MNPVDRASNWLLRRGRRLAARYSHPRVRNSVVASYAMIEPTAWIAGCTLSGSVTVGHRATLERCDIAASAPVSIGAYTVLTGPVRIVADIEPISIGKFCSLAPGASIREGMHDVSRCSTYFLRMQLFGELHPADIVTRGPITIGNDVWLGTNSVILSGVSVGDGAVVGAGAVVTKDVAPYTIVGGVPARVIRRRFPDEVVEHLQSLRWWDWDEERILRNKHLFLSPLTPESLNRAILP